MYFIGIITLKSFAITKLKQDIKSLCAFQGQYEDTLFFVTARL